VQQEFSLSSEKKKNKTNHTSLSKKYPPSLLNFLTFFQTLSSLTTLHFSLSSGFFKSLLSPKKIPSPKHSVIFDDEKEKTKCIWVCCCCVLSFFVGGGGA